MKKTFLISLMALIFILVPLVDAYSNTVYKINIQGRPTRYFVPFYNQFYLSEQDAKNNQNGLGPNFFLVSEDLSKTEAASLNDELKKAYLQESTMPQTSLQDRLLRQNAITSFISTYLQTIQPSGGAFAVESAIKQIISKKKDISTNDLDNTAFGKLAFQWDKFLLSTTEEAFCKSKASSYFVRDTQGGIAAVGALPNQGSIIFAAGKRTECAVPQPSNACTTNNAFTNISNPNGAGYYLYKLSWLVSNPNSKDDFGKKRGVRDDGSIVFSINVYNSANQKTGTLGQYKVSPGRQNGDTAVAYRSGYYSKLCIVFDEGYAYDGTHTEWPANCPNSVEEKKGKVGYISAQATNVQQTQTLPPSSSSGEPPLQGPSW